MENEIIKLSNTKEFILARINELADGLLVKKTNIINAREEMWREARRVLRDFDDIADLTIFVEDAARNEKRYINESLEIKKLQKMFDSPYFARIDFHEDDYIEQIYIGHYSLFNEDEFLYHVYDWRAPISSLFYDHGLGDAYFYVPETGEKIQGKIVLKRQYKIEKGEIIYMFDTDLTIEDDLLKLELSKSSDAHIKTIINTIQTEQNKAIRAESGDIFVHGPAGSGKTSVGLHRIAYLLYRHKNNLQSGKMRIFSPNNIFSSYISGIIPELGEEDVITLDLSDLPSGRPFLTMFEQIEYLMETQSDERCLWINEKYSQEFLDELTVFINSHTPTFEDVYFINDKICTKERLESLYTARTSIGNLKSKSTRVLEFTQMSFNEYLKENFKKIKELFNEIDGENYNDHEINLKFNEQVQIVLNDLKQRTRPSSYTILKKHLSKWAKKSSRSFSYAKNALKMERLLYEDALLLTYIDLYAGYKKDDKTIKHVLIDEAQDFSILHHAIIKLSYPNSNFTILADIKQAVYPSICINDINKIHEIYPKAETIQLTKSYRSTLEIMSFAKNIIGESSENIFIRHGQEPKIIKEHEIISTIESCECNTIGIIFSTIKKAEEFYKNYPSAKLITNDTSDFSNGTMILPVCMAKGLEFDAVICPEYSTIDKRLLYLICTRALHYLFLVE